MANLTDYVYDIFLSHNHADREWTTRLAERLEREDCQGRRIRVFFSPWDITPGQSIPKEIETALSKSRKVGIVLSPEAMASGWVELERLVTIYIAITARAERLIPLYRRDCEIPVLLQPILYIDFRADADFEEGFQTLLSVIKDERLPRRSRHQASLPTSTLASVLRPVVDFVARSDRDGRDLIELLRNELAPLNPQMVVLWGTGGVGKTTLAAEVARVLADSNGKRIIWVSADGRANFTFSTLLDDIAEQLNRSDLRPTATDQKQTELQPLIKAVPTLIVLDDFETIAPQEQILCREYLARRAPCPTLVTTRERIADKWPIPLDEMAPAEAGEFLEKLKTKIRDPGIYADLDRNRILTTAEFNPLIIQWIVAQIDLAHNPEDVLIELSRGEGDAVQRVFDRSFNLPQMARGGRAVLYALSLFKPSGTRPAIAEVAGLGNESDAKRFESAYETLASLWLLRQTKGGIHLAVEGLTREVARKRLAQDEAANDFRQRFVDYFRRYTETHSRAEAQDFDALEEEKDNILSAVDIALDLGDWESVKRLMLIVGRNPDGFLVMRGYWKELIDYERRAESEANKRKDDWARAKFSVNATEVSKRLGKYDEVRQTYEQSLATYQRLGIPREIASVRHRLGVIAQDLGEIEEARRNYNESLDINTKENNQLGIAANLHQLGTLAHEQGDLTKAEELYRQSLEIQERLQDARGIAGNIHNLARIEQARGNISEAQRLYNKSLAIKSKLGDQGGIAITLHQLGLIAQDQGNLRGARELQEESSRIEKRLQHKRGIAIALHQLGRLSLDQGDRVEARKLYEESLTIKKEIGDRSGIASTLNDLGRVAESENDESAAERLYEESFDIASKCGYKKTMAIALHQMGRLNLARQHFEKAEDQLNQSLTMLRELGDQQASAMCLESIANLRVAQVRFDEAKDLFAEALKIAETLGSKYRIGRIKHSRALLAEKENNRSLAVQLLRESIGIFEKLGSPKASDARKDLARVERDSHS